MSAEFNIQPEAFAFEAEPGEFAAWQREAPALRPPVQNRGSPDYIRWLQSTLNKVLGLRLAVDGKMGPQTRSAVRSFQQRQGLIVDGVVGPNTEAVLTKALSGAGVKPVTTVRPEPVIDIQKAIRNNPIYAQQLGWQSHYDAIVRFLGFAGQPSKSEFAHGVARWQQSRGLRADGTIGPSTWSALVTAGIRKPSGVKLGQSWVDLTRRDGIIGQIFFETGSAELDSAALAELEKFSCYYTIVSAPEITQIDFEFHGLADHRRFAREGGNLKLSENRAKAVWDRIVTVLGSGDPADLNKKFKGNVLGFGVDPQSTQFPKDPNVLKAFRRVDILGPPCELPPVKKKEDGPSGPEARLTNSWMARILGQGTLKAVAAGDLMLVEIVDRTSGLSKEFWYRGAGLGGGSSLSLSPSEWLCFTTSRPISINDFEGFASHTSGTFVTPIGAKLGIDLLTLTGPWMNTHAGVVHLTWKDFSLKKAKKGGAQIGATVGGFHPCKRGEPVCTPLKMLTSIPACP